MDFCDVEWGSGAVGGLDPPMQFALDEKVCQVSFSGSVPRLKMLQLYEDPSQKSHL